MANTPSVPKETRAGDGDNERDRRNAALARWRGAKASTAHGDSCRGSAWTHQRRQQARSTDE